MPKVSEKLFVIAMLFYTTGAVLPLLLERQNSGIRTEDNPIELAIQTAFYLGAFWFMAIRWRTVFKGALSAKWILCLTFVAIASTAWSDDAGFTIRRSVVLFATTLFGVYFGSRFTVPQQLRLLVWTFVLVVLSSFAIAILLPRYGIDHWHHPGDWQGAFPQKNTLARAMVLAISVFYFARPWTARVVCWVGTVGALGLLVCSRSLTGALVVCAIAATVPMYKIWRSRIQVGIPLVIAVVLTVGGSLLILFYSLSDVFEALHRDSTLTGRSELWNAVVMAITKRPFLGYGFGGFWKGWAGESATVWLTVQWKPLHSHNGFLDLMLELGLLGLVIFAVGYFVSLRRALALLKRMPGTVPVWLCTYLVFMLLANLTETAILGPNNIYWVLYTATAVSIVLNSSATAPIPETGFDLD